MDATVRRKNYKRRFRNQILFVCFAVCTKYCKFSGIHFTALKGMVVCACVCVCVTERDGDCQTAHVM